MWDNELLLRRDLEELPSAQLRTMLNGEMQKAVPDDDLVISILHILEDREPEVSDSGSEKEKAAWKLFQKRVRARKRSRLRRNTGLMRAAIVALAVCLLISAMPQQAEADNWWQRLTRWTDDFFGFVREEEEPLLPETYEFRTDSPGLQQVYDAAVELGITIPTVPMWLPQEYELASLAVVENPIKKYICAQFLNDGKECVLQINVLSGEASKDYFKNNADVKKHESGGVIHNLVQNMERWAVTWTEDNIECAFTIDCSEETLHEIIDSIYRWRVNE